LPVIGFEVNHYSHGANINERGIHVNRVFYAALYC
jgi:hypothetical protein